MNRAIPPTTTVNKTLRLALHNSPAVKAAFFPIIADFEQQTGIRVSIAKYTKDIEFEEHISKWFKQGVDSPDIIYAHASLRFQNKIKSGYAQAITHLWQKHHWAKKFPRTIINWVSYQNEIYGLPYAKSTWGLFYKKALVEKFGPVPEHWQAFIQYCHRLKASGIFPFNASTKQPWIATAWFEYFVLRLHGIEVFSQIVEGKISFHDKKIQQVFTLWAELINNDFFNQDYKKMRWAETLPLFHRNKFAFFFMSQRLSSDLLSKQLFDDTEFIAFPKIADISTYESTPTLVLFISSQSRQKKIAEKFIEFMAQAHTQNHIAEQFHMLPAVNTTEVLSNKFSKKGVEIINKAKAVSPFFDRATIPEFEKVAVQAFAEFMFDANVKNITEILEAKRLELFPSNLDNK